MLKQFNETFPAWIRSAPKSFGTGAPGYTKAEAESTVAKVRENMENTRGIKQIVVKIEPVEKDFYKVVNTSTYESDY